MALDKNWTTHMVVLPPTKSHRRSTQRRQPQRLVNTTQTPYPKRGGADNVPAGVSDFLTIREVSSNCMQLGSRVCSLGPAWCMPTGGISASAMGATPTVSLACPFPRLAR